MAFQPIIKQWDPMAVINLKVGAVALNMGDLCSYETQAVVLMDLVTEDATFCGVAGGRCGTTDAGLYIPIFTKCIVRMNLASATYDFGNTLLYSAKNTLADAATVNSVGSYWDVYGTTLTAGDVYFDIQNLGKLFEAPLA